ncbi:hypothetical protein [Novosphingobium sp. Gsoil 351]|uniref:hypothetical protein n=1 Tax=Novosphingobium sp. Gsoil 351 TaxID=2675225 RepID=UPI0012B4E563|nr:hypothetical protein [Novosphingobium sp. Gsoil 351]QGN54161.1 hypothetical protein GKE62_05995 [Novosphingobium sp. Gsoil 351]
MSQWDGNNYQLYTQILIGGCVICLLVDRFAATGDGSLFGLAILFLIVGIFLVPEGPQPPN